MQSIHEASFQPRFPLPGGRLDLAALPVVEVAPAAAPADPPKALPPGTPADVVVLKKGAAPRVSIRAFEAGVIYVDNLKPAAVGRQSEGGAVGVCGKPGARSGLQKIRYEAVRRVDTRGNIELVWARGFLDSATCDVSIVERHAARPHHVAGGVVYAFRTRCPACAEDAREVLHVLTPQLEDNLDKVVPFEHRTLALVPGKSAAFEGSSSFKSPLGGISWGMPDWHGLVDRKCKEKDQVWCFKRVRLEVSQGRGEPTPTAFAAGDLDL